MSAYVVTDETIDAVLTYAESIGALTALASNRDNATAIGQLLLDENHRAVNHRYAEAGASHAYAYKPYNKRLRPVEVLKLIQCISYQCCETDDWAQSEAHSILRMIEQCVIRTLPGYNAAAWSIRVETSDFTAVMTTCGYASAELLPTLLQKAMP